MMTIKTRVQGHHLDILYILVFVVALSETSHSKVKNKSTGIQCWEGDWVDERDGGKSKYGRKRKEKYDVGRRGWQNSIKSNKWNKICGQSIQPGRTWNENVNANQWGKWRKDERMEWWWKRGWKKRGNLHYKSSTHHKLHPHTKPMLTHLFFLLAHSKI